VRFKIMARRSLIGGFWKDVFSVGLVGPNLLIVDVSGTLDEIHLFRFLHVT
jgi:hypothetical protein